MPHKEQELYEPVKTLLERLGFVVKGEIQHCDIVAVKDELIWAVELKLAFNMKLLYQAVKRQNILPYVLVAVPYRKNFNRRNKDYNIMLKILKRQGLGFIVVALDSPMQNAELVLPPGENLTPGVGKKISAIKKDFATRAFDIPGGTPNAKYITAYKERCIKIAANLLRLGVSSPKQLVEAGCDPAASAVLRDNHYGWFEHIARGKYALSDTGREFLETHKNHEVVKYYLD